MSTITRLTPRVGTRTFDKTEAELLFRVMQALVPALVDEDREIIGDILTKGWS